MRGESTRRGEGQSHGSAIRRATALHTEHVQCCLEGGEGGTNEQRVARKEGEERRGMGKERSEGGGEGG